MGSTAPLRMLSNAALVGLAKVSRATKSHFWIVILSLGALTSLITAGLESQIRMKEAPLPNRHVDANVMMERSAPSMKMSALHQLAEPAPALDSGAFSSAGVHHMGVQQDSAASSYSGPEDGQNIGAFIAEAMNNRPDAHTQNRTRLLIHEGNVELKVYLEDMELITDKIVELTKRKASGYLESKNMLQETRWDYDAATHSQGNQYWFIHLELRIANTAFHEIINEITSTVKRHNGSIVNMFTQSRDATDEYVDVIARAETTEQSRKALELLLTRATTVYDVLQVQRELTSLTQQVESYKKRAIYLEKSSDMSRLSVHIREQKRPSFTDTPVLWDPYNTILKAFHHMKIASQFVGDALIYAFMWAIPAVVLILVSWLFSYSSGYNSARRD